MGKNIGLVLLVSLVLVLMTGIGYLWFQLKNIRQEISAPIFSKEYSVVAGGIDWRLNNFQPVVKGFVTEDGINYVLAGFTNQNNQLREVKLFVSGKTQNGYQIETVILQTADGQIEKLNFDQLKKQLKKGRQIRVEYINAVPELLDTAACQKLAENFRDLCFLTDVLAGQTISLVEEALKDGKEQRLLVPVTYLSLKLYEN